MQFSVVCILVFTQQVAVVNFNDDDRDLQILREVRDTAFRSHSVSDELRALKAKMYQLENDFRHL